MTDGRRAFRVAYDGTPFHGFQRQPDVPTVEDALFDALRDLGVLAADARDVPEGYAAAGRTDAGVSARAQTVAFEVPEWLSPAALNGELPASVRAWASTDVSSGFHATHDARAREYRYYLYAPLGGGDRRADDDRPGADAPEATFDDDPARDALATLAGEHDFHNLTPDDRGTVRELDASAERHGDFLVVRLRAGGFARQLVRRVVGLVATVGRGVAPLSTVERVLDEEPLEGPEGVAPASPEPLVLWDVDYGVTFTVDEAAATAAREVFGSRHAARLARARVAGEIRDALE
jgi:tRNA pseudouridine38-40 synthase